MKHRLRWAGRWAALAIALTLVWLLPSEHWEHWERQHPAGACLFPPAPWAALILPAISPFTALGSALATKSLSALSLLGLPVLILALFIPRIFCRYACPVGLLHDLVSRLRVSKSKDSQPRRLPPIGQYIALATLGGACLGYPILLWLDPLALLNGFLRAWRWPFGIASLAAGIGLPLILLLNLIRPKLWCSYLCPLGGMQELLAWPRSRIQKRIPQQDQRPDEEQADAPPPPSTRPGLMLARRALIGLGFGAAGAFAIKSVRAQNPSAPAPLRPPGAVNESRFTGLCIRCGNCVRACPAKIIQPDLGRHGMAGFMTPILSFDENYCLEDCHRCGQVCPSGAIARLSLKDKSNSVIGFAGVDLGLCLLASNHECNACVPRCPYDAIAVEGTADGFSTMPSVDRKKCVGCGACEMECPVRPQRAIRVYACLPAIRS
ncbi:MAG: 4Fe-4S binding protein [Candidatus Sumerlaeota bacterium]|nr:4Fe-4S binding protein [Candidatus Sumerlaeota bacterium]